MSIPMLVLPALAGPVPERQDCSLEQPCPVPGSHLVTYAPLEAWPVHGQETVFTNHSEQDQEVEVAIEGPLGRSDDVATVAAGTTGDLTFWAYRKRELPEVTVTTDSDQVTWATRRLPRSTSGKVCVMNSSGGSPEAFVVRGLDAAGHAYDSDTVTVKPMGGYCVPFQIAGERPRELSLDVVYVGAPDPPSKAPPGRHAMRVGPDGVASFPELDVRVEVHETSPIPQEAYDRLDLPPVPEGLSGYDRDQLAWRATVSCGDQQTTVEDADPGLGTMLCGYLVGVSETPEGLEVELLSP